MDRVNKLFTALCRAVAKNASTKQVNGIVAQLNRARGQKG